MSRILSPGAKPTGGNPMAHVAARGTLFIAALLILSYGPCAPVLAENNTPSKPQISIETKYVEISLTIDSGLKFHRTFCQLLVRGQSMDQQNKCRRRG